MNHYVTTALVLRKKWGQEGVLLQCVCGRDFRGRGRMVAKALKKAQASYRRHAPLSQN